MNVSATESSEVLPPFFPPPSFSSVKVGGVVVVVVVVVGQTVWPISSNQLLAKQLIASQATSP